MAIKYERDLDLKQNELQNAVLQNLASDPASGSKEGRVWMNTTTHKPMYYDGTDEQEFGRVYTEGNGIDISASNVISIDNTVTGATKCKITYNNQGLVTSGADLQASDIPSITLSKISDVTATASELNVLDGITASTTELNIMDGVTVSANDINSVTSKIGLTDLSIDSGSTNYLGYSNTTGKFSAKVDTTVTASSNKLVTSGAVASAIGTALTGALIYQGTWTATNQTDYSSITKPVKKGYMYAVSGSTTISGVQWNSGDYLVINKDVASDGTITSSDVEKIDNTEASDIVRLSATQTLTNKTIDADDNTITDLTTSNLKSGVLQTTVRATSSASDTAIPSEKAVASALSSRIISSTNSALTQSSGVCTWTISNTIGTTSVLVQIFEVSTGTQVMAEVSVSASTITIKMNSSTNISAGTYRAVILG